MKLLVLFGSSSDAPVYEPLVEALGKNHCTQFFALSAHRNADQLRECLHREEYDAVVAGAGLAAHLPGVVSSMTHKPVIGIPVRAQFGGMDSLLSILQMPKGVPVHTYGSDQFIILSEILKELESDGGNSRLQLLVSEEDEEFLLSKIVKVEEYCQKLKIEFIKTRSQLSGQMRSLELVNLIADRDHSPRSPICVPTLSPDRVKNQESTMLLSRLFEKPALFVGVNNVLNGLIANLQWMDIPNKEDILNQLKKGSF